MSSSLPPSSSMDSFAAAARPSALPPTWLRRPTHDHLLHQDARLPPSGDLGQGFHPAASRGAPPCGPGGDPLMRYSEDKYLQLQKYAYGGGGGAAEDKFVGDDKYLSHGGGGDHRLQLDPTGAVYFDNQGLVASARMANGYGSHSNGGA